ncbi:17457_t:CDS:2 [Rhizophagus irregularis]|nr:17457_t:CDS:2 [Rhizophagus irregularis]
MTLEIKGKIKNIHFLVDTGSPRTYVCEEVLKSYNLLFITDPVTLFLTTIRRFQRKVFTIKFKSSGSIDNSERTPKRGLFGIEDVAVAMAVVG